MVFGFRKKASTDDETPKAGLLSRLRARLGKTRGGFADMLATLVAGRKTIDDELLEELETRLLLADVGIEATRSIIDDLTSRLSRKELTDGTQLVTALRDDLRAILEPCNRPLVIHNDAKPFIILVVGVNGVGKTTTIGKLAKRYQTEGHSVMLAAGDTFRAAAVEQINEWGRRNDINVISQAEGADPASVIYDAVEAARARKIDVLIADTAGRLHTQSNLMEELKKIKRVIAKLDPEGPHETMLVIDAGTGQNALTQAQQFHEAIGLTGITLTKLDGTARGGIIFAIARKTGLPIYYIGVGEAIEDLQAFDADSFTDALFDQNPSQ